MPITKQSLFVAGFATINCLPWLIHRSVGGSATLPLPLEPLDPGRSRDLDVFLPALFYVTEILRYSQLQLFALWAALSPRPMGWRLCHLLAVALLLARMYVFAPDSFQWIEAKHYFLQVSLGSTLVTFGLAWAVLLFWLNRSSERRFQYGLGETVWSMAGFAVGVKLWCYTITPLETDVWIHNWVEWLPLFLAQSCVVVGLAVVMLSDSHRWLCIAIILAGLLVASQIEISEPSRYIERKWTWLHWESPAFWEGGHWPHNYGLQWSEVSSSGFGRILAQLSTLTALLACLRAAGFRIDDFHGRRLSA